jgi:SAM-dependent methyltransferase
MTDWTAGYVADIGYTFGYYPELNPLRAKLAFASAGLVCPNMGAACELGFGQGVSTNLHAAATLTQWHGTDFNPSQAGFAQELSAAAGAAAGLYDQAFADFAIRQDLPDFDYIGLHGIWSWISDENRAVIVDFIRRKLKVGGVLYISYNTQPGWAPIAPMRHLMTEYAQTMGATGAGITKRIDAALDFTDKLLATSPIYAKVNTSVVERMKAIKGQSRNYLAHEYFNRDWHPMHFATMAQWLEPAKVSFACSAHYLDHIDGINLTNEQQALLKDIPDAMFRETVRDFIFNQQFRRDYWVKGARPLSALDKTETLRAHKIILIAHRPDIALKVGGFLGEAGMQETIYNPILDLLADHKTRTIGQIELALQGQGIALPQIIQAVFILIGAGHANSVQDEVIIPKAKKHCDKLNAHLMQKARSGGDISFLASPVTGGGVTVTRFPQLFLLALSQGKKQPAEWAQFTWALLDAQNQKILKDGKPLATAEENLAELTEQAQLFATKQLPILKALQIV